MKTDLQQLARLVHLPEKPLAAQWETRALSHSNVPGPEDWQLLAVIEFEPQARVRLLSGASPAQAQDTEWPADFVRPWLPAAARALFEAAGDGRVRLTVPARDAEPFFSSPLGQGFYVPVGDQGRVFLFLQTR